MVNSINFSTGQCVVLSYIVVLYDVVHVLDASAGEVNEDGAGLHLLCKADSVGNSVAALNGGNVALKTGEGKESHPRAGAGTPPPIST